MSPAALGTVAVTALLAGACEREKAPAPPSNPQPTAAARRPASEQELPDAAGDAGHRTQPLYVKIPLALSPLERQEKFGDPLDALLYRHGLGEVKSVKPLRGEEPNAEAIGIDCRVNDAARAVPLLREKLRELGAPRGTLIEEERGADTLAHPVW